MHVKALTRRDGSKLGLALLLLGSGYPAPGGQSPPPHVLHSDRHDTSAPLREIRPIPPRAGEILELPRKALPNRPGTTPPGGIDPALQPVLGPAAAPTVDVSFEGINNRSAVLPPDTVGDVGPNHYVQAVNLSFAVYNKSGVLQYGPANTNTLWSGFGGACQNTNNGDPIVQYDHLADRWMISQFALPNYPFGPFYQCIAISQTPDPTGAWYRYQFLISNTKMNDYPKFGVWPDAYYVAVNQFNQGNLSWGGQGVVAFERDKMLNGQPADGVYFDLYGTNPNLGGMLPSDLDGAVPPAGASNIFAQIDDDAWGYSPDQLQLWEFHVNWGTPLNSTFTFRTALPTLAFDSNLCGYSRNCIPQPGTTAKLDALSDRLMYRLQYRNFGAYQTLVTNHTVDADGTDHAGIRWYELRNTGSGWSINQQGTFSPDATHRWMGSIAMDAWGNIALGYSVSSAGVYPAIRYTGRLAGDPLGEMTQGEGILVAGSGYQTHSAGRWGDYSSMSLDPDGCTFWYTQEYYQIAGPAPWQTRAGSFRLNPSCAAPAPPPPPPNAPSNLTATAVSSSQINLTWADNSNNENGFGIERCQGTACTSFAPRAQVAQNVTSYNDTGLAGGTTYRYRVYAFNSGGNSAYSNEVETTTQSLPSMHVGDLDGSATRNKQRWQATVTITVHNAAHGVLSGATVTGAWSGGYNSSPVSCTTTGPAGTCILATGTIPSQKTSVTFSVNTVTLTGYQYDSSANHDPDGDSSGTTIKINKP